MVSFSRIDSSGVLYVSGKQVVGYHAMGIPTPSISGVVLFQDGQGVSCWEMMVTVPSESVRAARVQHLRVVVLRTHHRCLSIDANECTIDVRYPFFSRPNMEEEHGSLLPFSDILFETKSD